ncbi:hypothetical protein M1525_00605 [Patescibacteria group bacterium]|nr:hypothetical protein [Patescibacteria group bacterium]
MIRFILWLIIIFFLFVAYGEHKANQNQWATVFLVASLVVFLMTMLSR